MKATGPVVIRKGKFALKCGGAAAFTEFGCSTRAVTIQTDVDEADKREALCGTTYGGSSKANDTLAITAFADFDDAAGLQAYSWKYRGCTCDFEWQPTSDPASKWTGKVVVQAFDIGGEVGEDLESDKEWTITEVTPPTAWGYKGLGQGCATVRTTPFDSAAAAPGDTFPDEATVTTEDAAGAAALDALGFVANPTTPWATGEKITSDAGLSFHWDGTNWQPGAAA